MPLVKPAILVLLYWSILWALHSLTQEHVLIGTFILALHFPWRPLENFRGFAIPFLLTAILYDSQRYYGDWIRGPIHVREPYEFDLHFFGIQAGDQVLTPNEWCQLHLHPILDLIAGFAYLVFFTVFILIAAYFAFYLSKKGTTQVTAQRISDCGNRMPWAFFWVNVIGYSTYYWYPAAPPWYVAEFGLGPVQMDVAASAAGCTRFDELLGTHFFSDMYGRAADVFGTVPSLHVAYPLLAVYFSFYFGAARMFSIGFYLVMCFSAVYLNHHYILDILWGSIYALATGWAINRYHDYRPKNVQSSPAVVVHRYASRL